MLVKAKLNSVEVLISKDLIELNITHDEIVSINNMQKEYDDMKEEMKKFNEWTCLINKRNINLRKKFTETNYKKWKKAFVYIKLLKLSDLLKFKLHIKECHQIVWNVEEIQKLKKKYRK